MKKHILMKTPLIFLFSIFISIPQFTFSQNFTREAGLRLGPTSGFTYRQYMNEANAWEGLISFKQSGIQLTVLKEFIQPCFVEYGDNFSFVWGYGAHVGSHRNYTWEIFSKKFYDFSAFLPLFGIDGYAAIEYKIHELPLSASLGFKPYFELAGARFFSMNLWDLAISIKYHF